jgi:hypothetical protein
MILDSPLTEEKSMQSSLDTRISMFPPQVSAQSAFAQNKIRQNTWTKIEAVEVFGFRCTLIGPKGYAGKHVRVDGVIRNLTHHFQLALGSALWQNRVRPWKMKKNQNWNNPSKKNRKIMKLKNATKMVFS